MKGVGMFFVVSFGIINCDCLLADSPVIFAIMFFFSF